MFHQVVSCHRSMAIMVLFCRKYDNQEKIVRRGWQNVNLHAFSGLQYTVCGCVLLHKKPIMLLLSVRCDALVNANQGRRGKICTKLQGNSRHWSRDSAELTLDACHEKPVQTLFVGNSRSTLMQ